VGGHYEVRSVRNGGEFKLRNDMVFLSEVCAVSASASSRSTINAGRYNERDRYLHRP
jgi:hypothetical protein